MPTYEYECKKCKYRTAEKGIGYQYKKRRLYSGVRYVIPVCAQRHLTKPNSREVILQSFLPSKDTHVLTLAIRKDHLKELHHPCACTISLNFLKA